MKKAGWALDLAMCVVAFVAVYLFFNLNRHYFQFTMDPLFSKSVHTGMDWSFLTPLNKFLAGLGIATVLWSWIPGSSRCCSGFPIPCIERNER